MSDGLAYTGEIKNFEDLTWQTYGFKCFLDDSNKQSGASIAVEGNNGVSK